MTFFCEKFLLKPEEQIVKEENVKFEGGLTYQSKKVRGWLIVTNQRLLFKSQAGKLGKDEKIIINITLDRFLTEETKSRSITSFLDKAGAPRLASFFGEFLIISFEDWFGIMQRPKFKTSKSSEWYDVINNITIKSKSDPRPIAERRKEIEKLKDFASYLSVEKFVRPLYFDPVSRIIQISDKRMFVDEKWNLKSPSELSINMKDWLKDFKVKTKW